MKSVYDNGALMLGNVEKVIREIKRELNEDIDMLFADKEEILKDLNAIKEIDSDAVVCVNYENGGYKGYSIDYWIKNDRI